ncbi:hypothetical protein GCM10010434_059510 [Winogradskya humida]
MTPVGVALIVGGITTLIVFRRALFGLGRTEDAAGGPAELGEHAQRRKTDDLRGTARRTEGPAAEPNANKRAGSPDHVATPIRQRTGTRTAAVVPNPRSSRELWPTTSPGPEPSERSAAQHPSHPTDRTEGQPPMWPASQPDEHWTNHPDETWPPEQPDEAWTEPQHLETPHIEPDRFPQWPARTRPADPSPVNLSATEPVTPQDPYSVRPERTESRHGDRVEGWIRPHYREDSPSGDYWTPIPETSYGWPTPVERLPELSPTPSPDHESEPTLVVPPWPPATPNTPTATPHTRPPSSTPTPPSRGAATG